MLVTCGALLLGCASSYRVSAPLGAAPAPGTEVPRTEVTQLQNLYVLGLFGDPRTDVRDLCPSGVAEHVAIRATWLTTFATVATLGLYSPLEQGVVCAPIPPEPP